MTRRVLISLSIQILFQTSSAFPAITPVDTTQTRDLLDRGVQIIPGGCEGEQLKAMETAIVDANFLAAAAINAAVSFTSPPFNYFFKGDVETSKTVTGALQQVQSALQKKGPQVNVTCTDTYRQCRRSVTRLILGYNRHAPAPENESEVHLCALGLGLSTNPKPCTEDPGAVSLGFILLHELMHVRQISPPGLRIEDLSGRTAQSVNDALIAGRNTTLDGNAYSFMGSMAWDMGLGGKPSKERVTCLQNFENGKFDDSGAEYAAIKEMAGLGGL